MQIETSVPIEVIDIIQALVILFLAADLIVRRVFRVRAAKVEITEMATEVQAKFLRVLEERQVRRIGGTANIPVAVRVVAATNRLPAAAVKEGKLRQDLFYRLNVFHLGLPPLLSPQPSSN